MIVIHSEINARFEVLVATTWAVFPPKFCRCDHSSSTSQSYWFHQSASYTRQKSLNWWLWSVLNWALMQFVG